MKLPRKITNAEIAERYSRLEHNINDLGNRMHRLETAERERVKGQLKEESLAIKTLELQMREINDAVMSFQPEPKRRWWQR